MANSSNIPGIPLERSRGTDNFDVWQRRAKSYLTIKGCWSVVVVVTDLRHPALGRHWPGLDVLDPFQYVNLPAERTVGTGNERTNLLIM